VLEWNALMGVHEALDIWVFHSPGLFARGVSAGYKIYMYEEYKSDGTK